MPRESRLFAAVIGAGPYGLSIAAHLRGIGDDFRIFGRPMDTWISRMPDGMYLKSEGFASNLSDPGATHTLEAFCAQSKLEYDDTIYPIPIDTFRRYGQLFQRDLVPNVDRRLVRTTERNGDHFTLTLEDGEIVHADNVVVATGFMEFVHMPPELARLPKELASHASDHIDFKKFAGREVAVIGAGQSALESAALLLEQGARPRLLVRRGAVDWNRLPTKRSFFELMTKPRTPLGRGRRNWVYSNAPVLFRCLPLGRRFDIVRETLGPAGGWWLRDRVVGKLPIDVNTMVAGAAENGGRVKLRIRQDGTERDVVVDHVLAGTGYVVDIRRLHFLASDLRARLQHAEQTPVLSPSFESSVPGLYFVGLAAAASFGPIMRFAAGATPTAGRLARHLGRAAQRNRGGLRHG